MPRQAKEKGKKVVILTDELLTELGLGVLRAPLLSEELKRMHRPPDGHEVPPDNRVVVLVINRETWKVKVLTGLNVRAEDGSYRLRLPVAEEVPGTDIWDSQDEVHLPKEPYLVHRVMPARHFDADWHQKAIAITAILLKTLREHTGRKPASDSLDMDLSGDDDDDDAVGDDEADEEDDIESPRIKDSKKKHATKSSHGKAGKFSKDELFAAIKQMANKPSAVTETVITTPSMWYGLESAQRDVVITRLKHLDVGPQAKNTTIRDELVDALAHLITLMPTGAEPITKGIPEACKILVGRLYVMHALATGHDFDEVMAIRRDVLYNDKKTLGLLATSLKKHNKREEGRTNRNSAANKTKKNNNKKKALKDDKETSESE